MPRSAGSFRRQQPSDRLRKIPHLQHLLDRRNAGDGLLAELANAVGERAQQLVADVDRAAAHSLHHARVFGLGAVEPGENHVLAGPARTAQNAQNLHLHRLRLAALRTPSRPCRSGRGEPG